MQKQSLHEVNRDREIMKSDGVVTKAAVSKGSMHFAKFRGLVAALEQITQVVQLFVEHLRPSIGQLPGAPQAIYPRTDP